MSNEHQHIPTGYKLSPLGIIPEDWEVKRLGDCFDICAGRDLVTETYSPIQTIKHQYPIFSNSSVDSLIIVGLPCGHVNGLLHLFNLSINESISILDKA